MRNKKGFTTGEVAELCHVTIPTVIKWIESGDLEGYKIPGSKNRRIPRENLIKFMKKYNIPTKQLENDIPRILIVDDEKDILDLFQALLSEEEYELRCVSRGFDAGLAKEFKPDVIILDILLPDIDGRQVCEYIKSMPEMERVKIIAISGYVKNEDELSDLLQKGFDDYLAKPFNNEVLLYKIHCLLTQIEKERDNEE